MRIARLSAALLIQLVALAALAQETRTPAASVELFSPQGAARQVRQVTARFTTPMVTLGDPRLPDPFDVSCPGAGQGRWADPRNWVYDFDEDLPAGLRCTFALRADLRTAAGGALSGKRSFAFTTGGPAIAASYPREGWEAIDETAGVPAQARRARRVAIDRVPRSLHRRRHRGADRGRSAGGRGASGGARGAPFARLSVFPAAVEKRSSSRKPGCAARSSIERKRPSPWFAANGRCRPLHRCACSGAQALRHSTESKRRRINSWRSRFDRLSPRKWNARAPTRARVACPCSPLS